jgi:opacity protein-like surface antigen
MNSLKKILIAVAVFAAASAVHAQQSPAAAQQESAGLLGKRTANLGFSYTDVKRSSVDAYGAATMINLPVSEGLDISASYDYGWVESQGSSHAHGLGLSATSYTTWGAVKPYIMGGLGYVWPHKLIEDNRLVYATSAGLEVNACSKAALDFSVGYQADFKQGDNSTFSATVGTNIWLTKEVAALASVSLLSRGHMQYSIGVAYRF